MASNRGDDLTAVHWLAVGLAAITGVIHLFISIEQIPSPIGVPTPLGIGFILAGLGFLAGIALFLRGWNRQLLYLVGVPYVLLQIVLYVVANWPDLLLPIGVIDKGVQIVLIAVLVVLYRRES